MKTRKSLLNQYLLLHFLAATLLPVCFLLATVGVFPSRVPSESSGSSPDALSLLVFVLVLFVAISWIFFGRIRKRLRSLQETMASPSDDGLPLPIRTGRRDEIGQLEESFNRMVRELAESRQREREEERLRRQLIASLSHDLRTPLTAIRGHASRLNKEPLTPAARDSAASIDHKISFLGQLVDNLLSYSLLTSGKYPYRPERTDIARLVRRSFVDWYPVFESMGFQIELDLPETPLHWEVDPSWLERMLDNCYQNVNRHARSGKYIAVAVKPDRIEIRDRGPGLTSDSDGKGAGIGLEIAAYMAREMKLRWEVVSGEDGTRVEIRK